MRKWKIDTWEIHGHTALKIEHCGWNTTYNMMFHGLEQMLTCRVCGETLPEGKMKQIIKVKQIIKKLDL